MITYKKVDYWNTKTRHYKNEWLYSSVSFYRRGCRRCWKPPRIYTSRDSPRWAGAAIPRKTTWTTPATVPAPELPVSKRSCEKVKPRSHHPPNKDAEVVRLWTIHHRHTTSSHPKSLASLETYVSLIIITG